MTLAGKSGSLSGILTGNMYVKCTKNGKIFVSGGSFEQVDKTSVVCPAVIHEEE
jgi:hypothetical protein